METRDQWYKPNLLYNIHWRPPKKPEAPKMVVETVRFHPSVCTCGEHDCEPRYRMEKRVLWTIKEMPCFKQNMEESGEQMRRDICNLGSEKKIFEVDGPIDDKIEDVCKGEKEDKGTGKTDSHRENGHRENGGNDFNYRSNAGMKTDAGGESGGDDNRGGGNGDGTGKNGDRKSDGNGRSRNADGLDKYYDRLCSGDDGDGNASGVETKRYGERSVGDGDRDEQGIDNNKDGNSDGGTEINGNEKSDTDSLDGEDRDGDNCLETNYSRAYSVDENDCDIQNGSGVIVEAEESVGGHDDNNSDLFDDETEGCNGYHGGVKENVDEEGRDDQDSFGDFEISPAFGILSIYCNSEIHCTVYSSCRPIGP